MKNLEKCDKGIISTMIQVMYLMRKSIIYELK